MTISSMGGFEDDDPADGPVPRGPRPRLSPRELALICLQTALRLLVGFAFIFWLMSLAPNDAEDSAVYPVIMAAGGSALYAVFFAHQLKGVYRARFPTLRAVEALILTATMFLAIFSVFYVVISVNDPDAFSEPLNSFSAYYFALTVLATVGFGDISPVSVPARAVTMAQMALDIAFIAVLIRVMGSAAKKALRERAGGGDAGT